MIKRLFGVRCFDIESGKVYFDFRKNIINTHLQVAVDGIDGLVWVEMEKISLSPIVHSGLSAESISKIHEICDNLRGFYDQSIGQWIDGFRRDESPEREIDIWLINSRKFRKEIDESVLSESERGSLYKKYLSRIISGRV